MIRLSGILFCCLLASTSFGQYKKFLEALHWSPYIVYDQEVPTEQRLSIGQFNAPKICGNFIEYINIRLKKKLRKPVEQDSLLNKICLAGLDSWNTNRFEDKYRWKEERPWIEKAIREYDSKFKMFISYAVMIDLVDYNPVLNYHYNKKQGESEIGLYAGSKRPGKDEVDEENSGPTPIHPKTEEQVVKFLYSKLAQNGFGRQVFSKSFSRIGLAVKLDEKTLDNKKRPRMYVMLIIAGKKNQKIRERYNPLLKYAEDIKAGKIEVEEK